MRVAKRDFELDADEMGKYARRWPRIERRKYPTGRVVWRVDLGKRGNKARDRCTFNTLAEAEGFAQQARAARAEPGAVAFSLPFDAQAEAIKLYAYLKPYNISFSEVQKHYATKVIPYLAIPEVSVVCSELAKTVADCRPSWRRTLKGFLKEFTGVFGERMLMDIGEDELRHFCFGQDRAPRTCKNRRAMAAQLFNYAINRWVKKQENPAKNLVAPPAEDKEPEYLKVDEVSRLLATASEFGLLGYALLNLFGAMRPDEVKKLDWHHVHLDAGQIEITRSVSKIHQAREIPINPTLAAWLPLCHQKTGLIVDSTNFDERFRAWRRAAQVNHWGNDIMRHTFASMHLAAYKSATETARQMGHIDTVRTLYNHYIAFVIENYAKQFWDLRPETVLVTGRKAA